MIMTRSVVLAAVVAGLLVTGCEKDNNMQAALDDLSGTSDSLSDQDAPENDSPSEEPRTIWDDLAPYSTYFYGEGAANNGDPIRATLRLSKTSGARLSLRDMPSSGTWEIYLSGRAPTLTGTTLSWTDTYGAGQSYSVKVDLLSHTSARVTVSKISGWHDSRFPMQVHVTED